MKTVFRILITLAIFGSFAARAQDVPVYVTPYLDGLTPALSSLRHLSNLMTACEAHFKDGCERLSEGTRSIGAETQSEIAHITVVDTSAIPDRSAQYWETDLSREFSASRADFLNDVMHYDVQLISHYAAARKACPPDSGNMDLPIFLEGVLHDYWGIDGKELEKQMDSMHQALTTYERQLIKSPESCESIRVLGYVIAKEMFHRLKKLDAQPPSSGDSPNTRLGLTVEYLWNVIAVLEVEARNQHFIEEYLREEFVKAGCTSVVNVSPQCKDLAARSRVKGAGAGNRNN